MQRRAAIAGIAITAFPLAKAVEVPKDVRPDKEIVLGQSAILSGQLSPPTLGYNEGALMAFARINSRGGIGGKPIRLASLDSGYDPARTVENCRKLLREVGPVAFFGTTGTPTTAAAIPVLRDEGVPLIGCTGVADAVRERATGVGYFARATFGQEAEKVVQHLATIGVRKVGAACVAGPGGEDFMTMLRKSVNATGGAVELVSEAMVAGDGSNVTDAADQIIRTQPQAMILYLIGTLAIDLIRQVSRAGRYPSYFGISILSGEAVAKALGSDLRGLTSCQVVPYPWSKSDPTAKEFQKLCVARNVPVNYYTYEGYLNALFTIDVLQRVGMDLGRSALHRALRNYRGKVGGMDLDFTAGTSAGGRFVELVHVRPDGSFIR